MKSFSIVSMFRALMAAILLVSATFSISTPAYAQDGDADSGCSVISPSSWYNCLVGDNGNLQDNIAASRENVRSVMGCWACSVFNEFAQVVFESGAKASSQSDSVLRPLIAAFGSVFALFYLGSSFVSGDASDLLQRWKVFWRLLISVAIGSAILGAGSFTFAWKWVYGPLMKIALAVESVVPGGSGDLSGCSFSLPSQAGAEGILEAMSKVVCGANNIALDGIAFGVGIASTGDSFIGMIGNFVAGVALVITFVWVSITFPLRFIDVLLRLCVVGILTPVLVVCAVFKPTRGYVQKAIQNVLYAGALFAFTGIMFKVGNQFLTNIMESAGASMTSTGGDLVGGSSAGEILARTIVLVGSGIIFAAMIKMSSALAAEFSGFSGQSGGVGDSATGFAGVVTSAPVKMAGLAAGATVAGRAAGGAMAKGAAGAGGGGVASSLGKAVTPP